MVYTHQGEREEGSRQGEQDQVKCIKDKEGKVLVEKAHIRRR